MPIAEADNPTILLVEDEGLVRALAAEILEDEGFRVREATSADEALVVLEGSADIGVLFTDVKMPGKLDGFALAAIVAERWPTIRIAVASAHVPAYCADIPATAIFLAKPYRPSQLVAVVQRLLGNGR